MGSRSGGRNGSRLLACRSSVTNSRQSPESPSEYSRYHGLRIKTRSFSTSGTSRQILISSSAIASGLEGVRRRDSISSSPTGFPTTSTLMGSTRWRANTCANIRPAAPAITRRRVKQTPLASSIAGTGSKTRRSAPNSGRGTEETSPSRKRGMSFTILRSSSSGRSRSGTAALCLPAVATIP